MTGCLVGGAELSLPEGSEPGEIVDCAPYGTELEVIGVSSPVVEAASELEADWGA